jgi:hypothetical protein
MYRRSTDRELRRYGVPHRIVGSPWYRSSNTACVYPPIREDRDWRHAARLAKDAHFRTFAAPQAFPLTGDGANAEGVTNQVRANLSPMTREALATALADARYYDWLDERRARLIAHQPRRTKMKKTDRPLEDILIEAGFTPGRYQLEINHSLQCDNTGFDDPWNLPSRLMQFPLEVQLGKDGQFHIGLMHPLIGDHPFVKQVAEAIKPHKINPDGAPSAVGHSAAPAAWWHACDLIREHRHDLLRTRQFTTDSAIVNAVIYALNYRTNEFGPEEAREVLDAIGAAPPDGDIVPIVLLVMAPSFVQPEKGAGYWPINSHGSEHAVEFAWLRVWGIEAGWFEYPRRGQHLQWSDHGRGMYRALELMQNAAE